MPETRRLRLIHYGLAVPFVALAAMLRMSLNQVIAPEETPFLLFFGAIMAAGWRGGFGPGMLATILAATAADIWFYTPRRFIFEHTPAESFWMLMFLLEGLIISLLCDLRKRSEEELGRFKLISDRANDAMFVADARGRFRYVNQVACRVLGFSRRELMALELADIEPGHDRQRYMDLFQRARHGPTEPFETIYRRRDNSELPVEVSVNSVPFGGQACVFAVARDISERKRAQAQLIALNATLEQRVAERTERLEWQAAQLRLLAHELTQAEHRERRRIAEVLHDHLQQLLVAAKLRIAAAHMPDEPQEHREALADITKLLDDSLYATRSLTAELRPPVLYEQGLVPALRWLADWMKRQHKLEVALDLDPAAEPAVDGNRILLFQSIRELLFNAVKYSGVTEARLSLSLADEQRYTSVVVEDHGQGFDPATLNRLKATPGGYGLFSIGERLKVLGGRMQLHSAPGQGTRVELWLPRVEPGGEQESRGAEDQRSQLGTPAPK